ncbi:hypothetical protein AABB24_010145 [Solanum stoloniferum]|uniref:V-type proton ATPase subunit G n=1 Tax=Solanum stoloniferum TaxID=62892 RepID=A0ABD2UN94_9SOLN
MSMESNRGNQNGIQQLLGAEQEAQHIVNAARSAKQARLKQAKDEAEKEIAEFRAFMEAEFQRKLEQTSGDSGANVKRLDQETFAKIQHLKAESESISNDVVQMLLRQKQPLHLPRSALLYPLWISLMGFRWVCCSCCCIYLLKIFDSFSFDYYTAFS